MEFRLIGFRKNPEPLSDLDHYEIMDVFCVDPGNIVRKDGKFNTNVQNFFETMIFWKREEMFDRIDFEVIEDKPEPLKEELDPLAKVMDERVTLIEKQIREFYNGENRINTIKYYRQITGTDLKTAKEAVDRILGYIHCKACHKGFTTTPYTFAGSKKCPFCGYVPK